MKKEKVLPQEQQERKFYKLSDDLIVVLRECVQLSLLTGTNIVDHLRSVVVEPDKSGKTVVPSPEYIDAYNKMIRSLQTEAEQKMRDELYLDDTEVEDTDTKPVN